MVRLKGLEPSRRRTLDPKSSASTNSATSAVMLMKKVGTHKILKCYLNSSDVLFENDPLKILLYGNEIKKAHNTLCCKP